MLRELTKDQAHFIALLARTARIQRDKFLGNVAEEDLGGTEPGRGEHNPTASLGFEPLPPDAEQMTSLGEAIDALTPGARSELYVLTRVGRGDLTAQQWHRGLTDAGVLGESATAALLEDPDLHDHLIKGLYELERA